MSYRQPMSRDDTCVGPSRYDPESHTTMRTFRRSTGDNADASTAESAILNTQDSPQVG